MSRHARSIDRPARLTGLLTVVLIWLAGLAAGFYALIGVAARYGCSTRHASHLGCSNGGTAVGLSLVVAVIVTVTAVTVLVSGRTSGRVLLIGLCGLAVLVACAFGTRALLNTV